MRESEARRALVAAARRTLRLGLNHGTTGNLSLRLPGGMLVTPSAVGFDALDPGDVPALTLDGAPLAGGTADRPTTEWRLHAAILKARPDVHAVVHAHGNAASALAALRRDIPAFHYMVGAAGGSSIRCTAYVTINTEALGDAAVAALDGGRRACLLGNHGLVACGTTAERAVDLAAEVDWLAARYLEALAVGEPARLSEQAMADVLARFEEYGR